MEKPFLLRAEIEKNLPELAQNPDKITLFITGGKIQAAKGTLSHETHYHLSLLISDFTGDVDILHAIIINWLQREQPQILSPSANRPSAYDFEVDILSNSSCDVLIQLNLIERSVVLKDEQGNVKISHPRNANMSDVLNGFGIDDGKVGG